MRKKILFFLVFFFSVSFVSALELESDSSPKLTDQEIENFDKILIDLTKLQKNYQTLQMKYTNQTESLEISTDNLKILQNDFKSLEKDFQRERVKTIVLSVVSGLTIGGLIVGGVVVGCQNVR